MKLINILFALLCCCSILAQEDSLKIKSLEDVIISAHNEREVAFEDRTHFVTDFYVGQKGTYLLLKKLGKFQLCEINERQEVISRLNLPFKPQRLFEDCLGFLHIMSKDSMYQIENIGNGPYIHESNSVSLFDNFYKDCVTSSDDQLILKKYSHLNQGLTYYSFDRNSKISTFLYHIEDTAYVRSSYEEQQEIRQLWALANATKDPRIFKEAWQRQTFFDFVITKAIEHPAFLVNDTTFIFDHQLSELVLFEKNGTEIKRYSIDHHKSKSWIGDLYLDDGFKNFYSNYLKKGQEELNSLDSNNFKRSNYRRALQCAPYNKLIIYEGYAYYTSKKNMDDHLNKFYRQKL